jgi:hypothetical protein
MKYYSQVTVETDITIKLDPSNDWIEHVKEFSDYMFTVDDVGDLAKYIVRHLAMYPDSSFIEGIGKVEYDVGQEFGQDVLVLYKVEINDVDETIWKSDNE